MGLDAAVEFLKALQRWIEKNKKFRVTFDYDPEWAAIIHFRLLDENELLPQWTSSILPCGIIRASHVQDRAGIGNLENLPHIIHRFGRVLGRE